MNTTNLNVVSSEEFTKRKSRMADFDQSLVPEIDPKYVPFGVYDLVHKILSSDGFAPIYIHGESGYGKTLTVQQVCAQLGREFILIPITSETTDENLIGAETLIDGNLVWQDGPLTVAARRGATVLFDEISLASDKILCIQEVMQNRRFLITRTGEYVYPQKGFMIFAADNTKGSGDFTGKFIGTKPMNRALLERFYGFAAQEAPSQAIEKEILSHHSKDKNFVANLSKWAASIRKSYQDEASEFEVCTRRLVQIVTLNNILKDDIMSLQIALSIFEDDFRDAVVELYTTINGASGKTTD